ncbi:hypothetical protein ACFQJ7_09370 [Halovenus rubra]|uniref:Uncharacterized protein n=2 Tax=Halovenus rubra TaxID=869890 RepID=A0ACC7DVS4_9EURY|nr:hypothetical protein [Halovenus rubra]
MTRTDLVSQVRDVLLVDPEPFREQVRADAEAIMSAIEEGVFDNPQAIIGLEYEFYAVSRGPDPNVAGGSDEPLGSLQRVPRRLLNFIRFEKELGLHNAELSTSPLPLNSDGLRAQEATVAAQLRTANQCVRREGLVLVSDGIWTIPTQGETACDYLTDSAEIDGVHIASNLSKSARYHAMANADCEVTPALELDAPHVSLSAQTTMPESLITSIQPHYQVPRAQTLPERFRYALRVAGPLLALGVNSPLFPPDLYDDVPPADILADARMSNRIGTFESVLNSRSGSGKVRFPRDIASVQEAVDRIVDDDLLIPMPVDPDQEYGAFQAKHGTYWRWVRPVFGGASGSRANARIEFRPIAAQPTVRDTIAFQAAFAGLMEGLPQANHPVSELDWQVAHDNFYDAAADGLDATLRWITGSGTETTETNEIFADIFEYAAEGLRSCGLSEETIGRYIGPLRRRVRHDLSPAGWKLQQVQQALDDGASFEEAVSAMQRQYIRRQSETLLESDFGAWIEDYSYRVR